MGDYDIRYSTKIDLDGIVKYPLTSEMYLRRYLGGVLGGKLADDVRALMRESSGAEKKSVKTQILGRGFASGGGLALSVYSTLIQSFVDETGAKWKGKMPPSKAGTPLYKWALREGIIGELLVSQARAIGQLLGKGAGGEAREDQKKRNERVTYAIALSIKRRGLPRPGDKLRAPFKTVHKREEANIVAGIRAALFSATDQANRSGSRY
jgi:hypothetical protein